MPYLENANREAQGYRKSETFEAPDTPPPVPARSFDADDDDDLGQDEKRSGSGAEDSRYATIGSTMSNHLDEGYSTVDETLQKGNRVS